MNKIMTWLRDLTVSVNEKKVSDIDFKDESFKKMLLDLKIESLTEITELNCEGYDLVSINEIKYFPNLQTLIIDSYNLEELDLTYNEKLKNITIEGSEHLTEIDFSKNVLLEVLKLENLFLENLDLKANLNLKKLFIDGLNELDGLDLTDNINLQELHLEHMLLDAILNEENKSLKIIYCYSGPYCTWTENGLPELEELTLENCELDSLNITCFPKLKKLDISGNQISEIDLSNAILLEELSIKDNAFTSINLEKNINLKSLCLGGDHDRWSSKIIQHTHLDVTNNSVLTKLILSKSGISEIDLSQNVFLETVVIDENQIKSIDLSKNILLERLTILDTILETLDISENKKIEYITLNNNKLSAFQFTEIVNIKRANLSKDLRDDKTIENLIKNGFIFEKDSK